MQQHLSQVNWGRMLRHNISKFGNVTTWLKLPSTIQYDIRNICQYTLTFYSDSDIGWQYRIHFLLILSFSSRKKLSVAISTPEVKYITVCENIFRKKLLQNLFAGKGMAFPNPSMIYRTKIKS